MKIKKYILIAVILIINLNCIFLFGCTNYDGFRRTKIPDENLGSVMLPENWEVVKENEKIYFINKESREVIAEEYRKGISYSINGRFRDERIYNEKFCRYITVEGLKSSGNSNGGQYETFLCKVGDDILKMGSLLFIGSYDSSYSLEIYVLKDFSEELLSKIAKSYSYDR